MADNQFDMRDHNRTFSGFIGLTKVTTVLVVLLLIGMAVFLV